MQVDDLIRSVHWVAAELEIHAPVADLISKDSEIQAMRDRNDILLEIIEVALRNARQAARDGEPLPWLEADHVHNLPGLIRQGRGEEDWTLHHYWTVDRVAYLKACKNPLYRSSFHALWTELEAHL